MGSLATPLGSGKTCSGCSGTSVRKERKKGGRQGGGREGSSVTEVQINQNATINVSTREV